MQIENLYNGTEQVENNITYSIDMIRLKTYISYSKFTEIEFRFATCWKKYLKKNFSSALLKNFFYNYVIEIEEGVSFWFGFLHNSEKRQFSVRDKNNKITEDTYNFTIEFNPNKIKRNDIIDYLIHISDEWYIKSYDLAIDIKIGILDLIWDLSGKHLEKIDNRGYDKKTIYIGKGDGRIKIYNKKEESNLSILGELTRIEVSRELEDYEVRKIKYYKYDDRFPSIYLNNYVYSLSDYQDKTLLAVLYAVQNGYPLRDLTRYTRSKIKKLLEGGYKINFSNQCATNALAQTIYYYFIPNTNVHWW